MVPRIWSFLLSLAEHRFFIIALMLIGLMNLPPVMSQAWAGERATLTFDPATSSSQCIGDPVTPLCAVETYEACRYWVKKNICEATGIDTETIQFKPAGFSKLSIYHYRIENLKVIVAEDISYAAKVLKEPEILPGDIIMQLRWEHCRPVDSCVIESRNDPYRVLGEGCPPTRCDKVDNLSTYLVRDIGNIWRVIEEYMYKSFHGDFWNRK